jgi:hypothetical protein
METFNEYPIDWMKTACESVYRSAIADRTWRDWLRICEVAPYKKEVTKQQAVYLLTLARIKMESPRNKKVTLFHVKWKLRSEPLAEMQLHEAVTNAYYTNATGADLPEIILRCTGRKVNIRTLYRWAEKHRVAFTKGKRLSKPEVEQWLSWASA